MFEAMYDMKDIFFIVVKWCMPWLQKVHHIGQQGRIFTHFSGVHRHLWFVKSFIVYIVKCKRIPIVKAKRNKNQKFWYHFEIILYKNLQIFIIKLRLHGMIYTSPRKISFHITRNINSPLSQRPGQCSLTSHVWLGYAKSSHGKITWVLLIVLS